MALHSVDEKNNAVDVVTIPERQALGTTSMAPVLEGQAVGKVVIKDNQVIVNDGTNDRVLIGFQSGGF
jgi:hypothetical protein